MVAKFCPSCAAPLDADARFCPSCRAPVGVASALASEITGGLRAGVRSVVSQAGESVPPYVWAAVIQIYWLLSGACLLLLCFGLVVAGMGGIGAASELSSGLIGGGVKLERVLLMGVVGSLAGIFDVCLSVVAVYGFLTSKSWAHGLFMVWLPVKIVLGTITVLAKPSFQASGETPFIIVFVIALALILNIAALVVQYMVVKRGNAALAES